MILSFVVVGILVLLLSIIFMFLALFIVNECNVILLLLGIIFLIFGNYFFFQGYYDEEIEFCNIKCDEVGIDKSSYSAYTNTCSCKTNIDKTYSNLNTMVVVIE